MPHQICLICSKPIASLQCGICGGSVCKKCAQVNGDDAFAFLEEIPEPFRSGLFCPPCFNERVEPALAAYTDTLERARNVFVFFKTQSKETRLFDRTAGLLKVQGCADRDEALLKLAFLAAQKNFNTLVDVEITSEKVRMGSYQTSKAHACGIPTQGDPKRIKLK